MKMRHGFPYVEIEFTKVGDLHGEAQVKDLEAYLAQQPAVTDLFVISHGWNNNMEEAQVLYDLFLAHLRDALNGMLGAQLAGRTFAVMGVLWPSKKYTDASLIAGGSAAMGSAISDVHLSTSIENLKELVDDAEAIATLSQAETLIPSLAKDQSARPRFAELILSTVTRQSFDDEDGSAELFALPPEELMRRLAPPVLLFGPTAPTGMGSVGGAGGFGPSRRNPTGAAVGNVGSGGKSAAEKLLNLTTYYMMKDRAISVGSRGVNQVLRRLRAANADLRLHLIGHSFGGLLVTAATAGSDDQPAVGTTTMTLLQAAFSHYGFAQHYRSGRDGRFRRVVTNRMVKGPVLITHTKNDDDVGYPYALASLAARQTAVWLGDKKSRFGAIGSNGAQKTPEAVNETSLPLKAGYALAAGNLYNLKADTVIENHSDIAKADVARAVVAAVAQSS